MSKTLDYFLDLYELDSYEDLIEFIENQGWNEEYMPFDLADFLNEWSF